jgi:hypothetical protein
MFHFHSFKFISVAELGLGIVYDMFFNAKPRSALCISGAGMRIAA